MNPREHDILLRKDFAEHVLDSKMWQNAALDLLDAVKALEPVLRKRWSDFVAYKASVRSLMIHKTFLLLVGLTVENFLKSRIVRYRRRSLRDEILKTGKLPTILRGDHNLLAYAESAKLPVSDEHRRILSRLTRAVKWSGRYPSPSSYEKTDYDNYSSDDIDQMKEFVNDLFGQLRRAPQKRL